MIACRIAGRRVSAGRRWCRGNPLATTEVVSKNRIDFAIDSSLDYIEVIEHPFAKPAKLTSQFCEQKYPFRV
jgi:hypothetical protein